MNTINTVLGALIAALIGLGTAMLAIFQQPGIERVSDISDLTWLVLFIGGLITFLKDFQAIWSREKLSLITKVPEVPRPPESK